MTLDKLEGIRGDDDWREWDFPQLVEALRKWTERNPLKQDDRATEKLPPGGSQWYKRSKTFQAKQIEWKPRACVYCEGTGHNASDCNKVVSVDERKKILSENSSSLTALVLNIGLQSVVVGQDACTAKEDITHLFVTEEKPNRC